MFRNAQDFILLAGSHNHRQAHQLIIENPEQISSLFQNAEEVIQLAGTNYQPNPNKDVIYPVGAERAYELIHKQSANIIQLFKNSEQFIKLAKASSSPALALINLQSKTIMDLFNSVEKFIQLASETDLNLACNLINNERAIVLSLFNKSDDIQKLSGANSQVGSTLITAKNCSQMLARRLLRDLFSSTTTYTAVKEATIIQNYNKM